MIELPQMIEEYLAYCCYQKRLSAKTCKAYRIDLTQFSEFALKTLQTLSKQTLNEYVVMMHQHFRPKSVKRKIASIRAFFKHLEYEELIEESPLAKIQLKFKEPFLLPKTIPLDTIEEILAKAHQSWKSCSGYKQQIALRDAAVLEMLFATGIRVSELCSLKPSDVDLTVGVVKIYGKGAKERIVQIGNADVIQVLEHYHAACYDTINASGFFYVNRLRGRLSEQSVRSIINRYVHDCGVGMHITPHMFRHSFATLLLEEDVDIRYIQHILGHSSITTTQIYTHVSSSKQRNILTTKHPRNKLKV